MKADLRVGAPGMFLEEAIWYISTDGPAGRGGDHVLLQGVFKMESDLCQGYKNMLLIKFLVARTGLTTRIALPG